MRKPAYLIAWIAIFCLVLPNAEASSQGESCDTPGATEGDLACVSRGRTSAWQRLETVQAVQAVINRSVKQTQLPKDMRPALSRARKDAGPWMGQVCAAYEKGKLGPECVGGDPDADKTIVVYGDSHASMWMSAIDSIAKASGYRVHLFAKMACPLVEAPIWNYQTNRPFEECSAWQQLVLPRIKALQPDVLIVTNQWKPAVIKGKKSDFATPMVWEAQFPRAMERLDSYAGRLVVVSNIPSMQQDAVSCASRPGADIAQCASSRAQAGNEQINRIEEEAARNLGATFINTVDMACTEYRCPVVVGDKFVYLDRWHFTETYVKWLIPVMQKALAL